MNPNRQQLLHHPYAETDMRNAQPMGRTPNRRRLAALAALPLAALLFGCGHDEPSRPTPEALPPIAVEVAPAQPSAWSDALEFNAGVLPLRRATPGTVLMGRVEEVRRDAGDRVRRGEVLAVVESREVTARLAQAEAGVAAARAGEQNARLMKERIERLYERQAAPQKQLDDARAGYEAAVANLRAAEEAVKAAKMYVSYTQITAPFDGVVVEKRVEVGDMAAPGMPLFVIEDVSRVKIEAAVPESTVSRLEIGQPVTVQIQGQPYEGKLGELLPAGDPHSRTFTVRVWLDNPRRELRSGMFARLLLAGGTRDGIVVPGSAIVRQGPLTGLFVVDNESTARLRWVTVGRTLGEQTEVLTGLAPGEQFVVRPPEELQDGRPIEVRK